MKKPFVSFVVYYFTGKYPDRGRIPIEIQLTKCLDSLRNQTCKDFKVIVVGDKIDVGEFKNLVVPNHDCRSGKLLNSGIYESSGEFVHFIQADFILFPDHVQRLQELVEHSLFYNSLTCFANIKTNGERTVSFNQRMERSDCKVDFNGEQFGFNTNIQIRFYRRFIDPREADRTDGFIHHKHLIKFNEEYLGIYNHAYPQFCTDLMYVKVPILFEPSMKIIEQSESFLVEEDYMDDQRKGTLLYKEIIKRYKNGTYSVEKMKRKYDLDE